MFNFVAPPNFNMNAERLNSLASRGFMRKVRWNDGLAIGFSLTQSELFHLFVGQAITESSHHESLKLWNKRWRDFVD